MIREKESAKTGRPWVKSIPFSAAVLLGCHASVLLEQWCLGENEAPLGICPCSLKKDQWDAEVVSLPTKIRLDYIKPLTLTEG